MGIFASTQLHLLEVKFDRGLTVFHRCAEGRKPGIVTGVEFRGDDVIYRVAWGDRSETWHYGLELIAEYVSEEASALGNMEETA